MLEIADQVYVEAITYTHTLFVCTNVRGSMFIFDPSILEESKRSKLYASNFIRNQRTKDEAIKINLISKVVSDLVTVS